MFSVNAQTHRDLADVNNRYDQLRKTLLDSLEDLQVAERCLEESANIQAELNWVIATDAKLEQARPQSSKIEPLEREVNNFQVRCLERRLILSTI